EQVTLAEVAAASGLTKAALYRYFRSRELLYIAVYREHFAALVDTLCRQPPARFPHGFADVLLAHPLVCSLTAVLHVALETGLSEQEARDFKLFLLAQSQRLVGLLQQRTGRSEEDCRNYLMQCHQALIGCWHTSHPPEPARRAMASPPLDVFEVDFAATLKAHMGLLTDAFTAPGTPGTEQG
ncbi:MAG: TetR family transcriptional regulator, partial [Marinobacter sp.]|uniref:TetR family transcriptional regulator n=1 Tax=Marinobacter sp. TaxID=50741 RepID=UPI00299D7DCD